MERITHSELLRHLHYDENTGHFTWLVGRKGTSAVVGKRAGSLHSPRGYRKIGLLGQKYYVHRLAWFYVYQTWPPEIDHINRDPDDNRIVNLRLATHAQNAMNMRQNSRNKSGYRGVFFFRGRWVAKIGHNYKFHFLGSFESKEEARLAYLEKARELYGDFANV